MSSLQNSQDVQRLLSDAYMDAIKSLINPNQAVAAETPDAIAVFKILDSMVRDGQDDLGAVIERLKIIAEIYNYIEEKEYERHINEDCGVADDEGNDTDDDDDYNGFGGGEKKKINDDYGLEDMEVEGSEKDV